MILTVSDDIDFCKRLHRMMLSVGVFSFFVTLENLSDFVECSTEFVDLVVIGGCESHKDARIACEYLRKNLPSVNIKALTGGVVSGDLADLAITDAQLIEFARSFSVAHRGISPFQNLKISPSETKANLLGYPVRLTKSEHKILLLLSSDPERIFSGESISRLAFPFHDISKNQLAVHICNINKKAEAISGRKLIINPHKNGYMLNPHL